MRLFTSGFFMIQFPLADCQVTPILYFVENARRYLSLKFYRIVDIGHQFITGVVDTSGKLIAGVKDTDDKTLEIVVHCLIL